jgi:hypothetical protein
MSTATKAMLKAAFLATDEAKAVIAADLVHRGLVAEKVVLGLREVRDPSKVTEAEVVGQESQWRVAVRAANAARDLAAKTPAFRVWQAEEQKGKPLFRDGGYTLRRNLMRECFGEIREEWQF